jgi:heme exporter protein D
MQFNSFAEFLNMGGYGSYVWSSVIIVLLLLAALVIESATAKKRTFKKIKQELERAEMIARAKKAQNNS